MLIEIYEALDGLMMAVRSRMVGAKVACYQKIIVLNYTIPQYIIP